MYQALQSTAFMRPAIPPPILLDPPTTCEWCQTPTITIQHIQRSKKTRFQQLKTCTTCKRPAISKLPHTSNVQPGKVITRRERERRHLVAALPQDLPPTRPNLLGRCLSLWHNIKAFGVRLLQELDILADNHRDSRLLARSKPFLTSCFFFLLILASLSSMTNYLLNASRVTAQCSPMISYIPVTYTVTSYVTPTISTPAAYTDLVSATHAPITSTSTYYLTVELSQVSSAVDVPTNSVYSYIMQSGTTSWFGGVAPNTATSLVTVTTTIYISPSSGLPQTSVLDTATVTPPPYVSTSYSAPDADSTMTLTTTRTETTTLQSIITQTRSSFTGMGTAGWNSTGTDIAGGTGMISIATGTPTTITGTIYWSTGTKITSTSLTTLTLTLTQHPLTTLFPETSTSTSSISPSESTPTGSSVATIQTAPGPVVFPSTFSNSLVVSGSSVTFPSISPASYDSSAIAGSSSSFSNSATTTSSPVGIVTGFSTVTFSVDSSSATLLGPQATSSSQVQGSLYTTLLSVVSNSGTSLVPTSTSSVSIYSPLTFLSATGVLFSSVQAASIVPSVISHSSQVSTIVSETQNSSSLSSVSTIVEPTTAASSSISYTWTLSVPSQTSTVPHGLTASIQPTLSVTSASINPLSNSSAQGPPNAYGSTSATIYPTPIPITPVSDVSTVGSSSQSTGNFSQVASSSSSQGIFTQSSAIPQTSFGASTSSFSTTIRTMNSSASPSTTISSTTLRVSSTVQSESPTPSVCGEYGNFTLNFDDLPNFSTSNNSTDITQAPPIFNGYHHFAFSNGYVYAPPPSDPFPPRSPPHLAVFLANASGSGVNNTPGAMSPTSGMIRPGEFGDGSSGPLSAYWFNAYNVWLGCDNPGPEPCTYVITGYTWDTATQQEQEIGTENATTSACPGFQNCQLEQVTFPNNFQGLSGLQIQAYRGPDQVMFFMDDVSMGWYNNTCAAGLQRLKSPRGGGLAKRMQRLTHR